MGFRVARSDTSTVPTLKMPSTPLSSDEAARLRMARWLERGIPVVVLVSLPTVRVAWHDQGQMMGMVLLVAIVAVEATSGLFLPWFFRFTVRRRRTGGPARQGG